MDARIGILCREGRTIYYAYDMLGHYVERVCLEDIEHALKVRDMVHTAPAPLVVTYKPEIQVNEEGGANWYPNALVFATHGEALASAKDTYSRWMLAVGYRAVESHDAVNYQWVDGVGLVEVAK